MSLDLYLTSSICPTCGHSEESIDFNITYNLSKMWYYLYPDDKDMLPIDGMMGKESLDIIDKAIIDFNKNREQLLELNPPNKWGSYEGFLATLHTMHNACIDHPDWIWRSWR